jgi:hypothetical protein
MTTRFTFHMADGTSLRLTAQELSVKGAVRVYEVGVSGQQYILKFTTAFDVAMHQRILDNPLTREYAAPLFHSLRIEDEWRKVVRVEGRAAWSRGPYKLMPKLATGPPPGVNTEPAVTLVAAIHHLPVPGDWMNRRNMLHRGDKVLFFDFDDEEHKLTLFEQLRSLYEGEESSVASDSSSL